MARKSSKQLCAKATAKGPDGQEKRFWIYSRGRGFTMADERQEKAAHPSRHLNQRDIVRELMIVFLVTDVSVEFC